MRVSGIGRWLRGRVGSVVRQAFLEVDARAAARRVGPVDAGRLAVDDAHRLVGSGRGPGEVGAVVGGEVTAQRVADGGGRGFVDQPPAAPGWPPPESSRSGMGRSTLWKYPAATEKGQCSTPATTAARRQEGTEVRWVDVTGMEGIAALDPIMHISNICFNNNKKQIIWKHFW